MPFTELEDIIVTTSERRAVGSKVFRADEPYLRDHYPGYPLVPGIIVLDGVIQVGALLTYGVINELNSQRRLPILAMLEMVKFLRAIRPNARVDVVVHVVDVGTTTALVDARAEVDSQAVVTARMMYSTIEMTADAMSIDHNDVMRLTEFWDCIRGRVIRTPS